LEELDFHLSESASEFSDSEDVSLEDEDMEVASKLLKRYRKGSQLVFDDLVELLREAEEATKSVKPTAPPKPFSEPAPINEPPKKKRKTATTTKLAPVFELEEPIYVPSKPRISTQDLISREDDAFGDATILDTADAADKKARRRTLRFHTSKIESASARRQGARVALGGDDDVPYRERRKEKEARAQREAQAGKRGQGGDDLDDVESGSSERVLRGTDADDDKEWAEESTNGYYSLVQKQKREQKESKKMAYEAAKAASRCVIPATHNTSSSTFSDLVTHTHRMETENDSAGGPRSLTRAILKNRGLTPHRSKSVRNPRVKKRQKFAKAKKVIASQKAVFKPGVGDWTRYDGERTGISTVVKSVQF
jgi:U3 small nucleolar RNA-associated protein 3